METELAGPNTLSYSIAHSSPRFFPDCTIALVIRLQQKQREITLSYNMACEWPSYCFCALNIMQSLAVIYIHILCRICMKQWSLMLCIWGSECGICSFE